MESAICPTTYEHKGEESSKYEARAKHVHGRVRFPLRVLLAHREEEERECRLPEKTTGRAKPRARSQARVDAEEDLFTAILGCPVLHCRTAAAQHGIHLAQEPSLRARGQSESTKGKARARDRALQNW